MRAYSPELPSPGVQNGVFSFPSKRRQGSLKRSISESGKL